MGPRSPKNKSASAARAGVGLTIGAVDEFIARHLAAVSRTYAILIPRLPAALAERVGLAYLLMRVVDTLEDDPALAADHRARLLHGLDAQLAQLGSGASPPIDVVALEGVGNPREEALMRESGELLRRIQDLPSDARAALVTCAQSMIAGVRIFQARGVERERPYPAIRDAAELREYCYYVAGIVGEMLCDLMARHLDRPRLLSMKPVAVELGIGLQMVNILKDAARDAMDGRRYLPTLPAGRVDASEVTRAVLAEARQCLQRGLEFVLALPSMAYELRMFCGLPIAWGAMTLARAAGRSPYAKIGRGVIRGTLERFARIGTDDAALRRWLTGLLEDRRAPA